MEKKEKVKYFNQSFYHILNKFSDDSKPHDSITINYYTYALSTSIVHFIMRAAKPTLIENYEEAISIEKYMHVIGVITYDESTKDSNDTGNRFQTYVSKAKEKETSDIENLTHLIKSMTTEVVELKHRKNKTTMSSRPPRYLPKKNVASNSSSSQLTKSAQSSNMVLNIEKISTNSYCTFHHKHHLEKKVPIMEPWNEWYCYAIS